MREGERGRETDEGDERVGLQLYIYHAGIQHCARNPDGMPIGRRNVVTRRRRVSNARIILQTSSRREFPPVDTVENFPRNPNVKKFASDFTYRLNYY